MYVNIQMRIHLWPYTLVELGEEYYKKWKCLLRQNTSTWIYEDILSKHATIITRISLFVLLKCSSYAIPLLYGTKLCMIAQIVSEFVSETWGKQYYIIVLVLMFICISCFMHYVAAFKYYRILREKYLFPEI